MNEFVRSRIKARQWSLARQIRSTPLPFYTIQRQISPYPDPKLYPHRPVVDPKVIVVNRSCIESLISIRLFFISLYADLLMPYTEYFHNNKII